MGFRAKVARSTLADANESLGFDLDSAVYALDSTTINACLSVFPWARFRPGSRGAGRSKVAAPEATPQRVRVGGNVQATKIVKMVRPVYLAISKAAGVEGAVILEAAITKEGNAQSLRVMNSQIDPDLAKEAVSQWPYQPTLLNGQPVGVLVTITVNFALQLEK
jgi:TonB family protein